MVNGYGKNGAEGHLALSQGPQEHVEAPQQDKEELPDTMKWMISVLKDPTKP